MATTTATTTNKGDKNEKEKPKNWLPPSKLHNMTETEKRQRQLDKLFEKIDTPIHIPTVKNEKKVFKAKDFVRNVSGSSAGAGSGDFHVYRALRRREYSRMESLEQEEKRELAVKEYKEEIEKMKQEGEDRTAKKRARRQKRKQNKEEHLKEQVKKQKVEETKKE